MDPTIYTMGDPMIVREALFALAAIFNSADWFNPANAFGLGGNLLAAALIGLLGILIAGISTQTMRVDYLLVAFVMFAVAFGVKVDVNIEDIQTGNASNVDDVPAGVAYVASLASSASYELAQDLSTALQRVGSETSVLTADGFLNPLKVLLALRGLSVEALDPTLHQTILGYYRFCVGKTLEQPGSTFSLGDYLNHPNPIGYLVDMTKVQNWMTVEYTEAVPEGVARDCETVGVNIEGRMAALTAGAGDRLELWASRALGSKEYDDGFALADLQDALNILNRGGYDAQQFMANQMIANLHNAGEAWRVAEYGSDKSQYVATLTEAMESQRVEVVTQGSIFLQMMFPLMGFFQFLFFALPPIIVLVMLAAPAAAARILGFYLLFGVWAYGWVPIAAVINHYIQIAVQNDIQFARPGLVASGYTAILGFDSLYNVVATKLTIGANALASVPVILGAILTATPFAISNIAGRMSGGAKVNTSIAAPGLLNNGPLMQRAAMASASVGSTVASGGRLFAASSHQTRAYGAVDWGTSLGKQVQAQTAAAAMYRQQASAALSNAATTVRGAVTDAKIESGQKQRFEGAFREALGTAYKNSVDTSTQQAVGSDRTQAVVAQFAFDKFGVRLGSAASSTGKLSVDERAAVDQMLAKSDDIVASVAQSIANTEERETEIGTSLRSDVSTARANTEAAERAESLAQTASETLERKNALGLSGRVEVTDFATQALLRDSEALSAMDNIMSAEGGARLLNNVNTLGGSIFERSAPMGLDGKKDKRMDMQDRAGSRLLALEQLAGSGDEAAGRALMRVLREVGGLAIPVTDKAIAEAAAETARAESRVDAAGALAGSVDAQIAAGGDAIAARRSTLEAMSSGIRADAEQRQDIGAQVQAWKQRVNAEFDRLDHPVRQAAATIDTKMAAAQREQEKALSTKVVNWARPGSGSDAEARAQLEAIPAGVGEDAQWAGAQAVAGLGALMRAQGDVSANPEKVYSDLIKAEWSPKAAAQAAYASVGARTSGGAELIAAGLGVGAVTDAAMSVGQARAAGAAAAAAWGSQAAAQAASAARWFGMLGRFGGPVAAAVTMVGGAAVTSWADKKDAAAIDAELKSTLWQSARSELGEAEFKAFESWVQERGGAKNAEQLANYLSVFESGRSQNTGEVGAFPAVGGDAQQTVRVWNDRLQRLE